MNIVLDIDMTLVNTNEDESHSKIKKLKIYSDPKHSKYRDRVYAITVTDINVPPGSGEITKMQGIFRPYLDQFIDFCFMHFNKVIIWSAGTKKYVREMCKTIFKGHKQPHLILTREDCVMKEGIEEDGEVVYEDIFKSLHIIFDNPKFKDIVTPENTFVIDDRSDTFSLNPGNGILIPRFEADIDHNEIKSKEDKNLMKLIYWFSLKENSTASDVRKLKKDCETIFEKDIEWYIEKLKKQKKL